MSYQLVKQLQKKAIPVIRSLSPPGGKPLGLL